MSQSDSWTSKTTRLLGEDDFYQERTLLADIWFEADERYQLAVAELNQVVDGVSKQDYVGPKGIDALKAKFDNFLKFLSARDAAETAYQNFLKGDQS
jgi:hypothetical protein